MPLILTLAPRGAAAIAGFAGVCGAGRLATDDGPHRFQEIRAPMAFLLAIVIWAGLSAAWALDPARSLILDARLAGLFAASLALAAAASRLGNPWKLCIAMIAGTGLAIICAAADLATSGGLTGLTSVRAFAAPRLNQIAVWLTIMVWPIAALLWCRGRIAMSLAAVLAMVAAIFMLEGTTAKLALLPSVLSGVLLYFWRRSIARSLALLSFCAVLAAPLVLPRLAADAPLFARIDSFKESAGHRLLIWSFVGERIAEHPLRGWGLDTSRAIPGGSVDARPGEKWLPLHPHNAALQVWLELGLPGALIFALLLAALWWRVGEVAWPRVYAAAAGASLAAALSVALAGWGIWAEWWLGTLGMAIFAVLVMGQATEPATRP